MDAHRLPEPSGREEQIVRLVAAGLGNKEIAKELGISRRTVATHLERLFSRIEVHSRAQAVARLSMLGRLDQREVHK